MVKEVRLYFEGDPRLRRGMSEFLAELRERARRAGCGFRLIACGNRTLEDFCDALRSHPDAYVAALLDSDGPLTEEKRQAFFHRRDWSPPAGAADAAERVFWMVQVMEAWFLADPETLAAFFGDGFQPGALRKNPRVEQIPKADVLESLRRASGKTRKGPYHKTAHAPELLARIRAGRVRAAAPNCERFFTHVLGLFSE